MSDCRLCGGDLASIGSLGYLQWLKCINCGMQFSTEHDDQEENEDE